jgi:hypothetical protein
LIGIFQLTFWGLKNPRKLGISIEADATSISIEVDAAGISIPSS